MNLNGIKIGEIINLINNRHYNRIKSMIPSCPGIYKVFIREEDRNKIKFGEAKTINGLEFRPPRLKKGKINTKTVESVEVLEEKFKTIKDNILYIGKSDNLYVRIKKFLRMALGSQGHDGGINIFAVQNYMEYLYITWYPLSLNKEYSTAKDWEYDEIQKFKNEHNDKRPLANLSD